MYAPETGIVTPIAVATKDVAWTATAIWGCFCAIVAYVTLTPSLAVSTMRFAAISTG